MNSREWINLHRENLRKQFTGKTIVVSGNKVVKIFDGAIDPLNINKTVKKLHLKDWSYTYLPKNEDEYLL